MLLLAYTEDRSTVYFKCCSEKQNLSSLRWKQAK